MEEIRSQVLRLVNETRGGKGVDPGPDLNRLRNKCKLLRTELATCRPLTYFTGSPRLQLRPEQQGRPAQAALASL